MNRGQFAHSPSFSPNLTGNTSRLSIHYWLRSLAVDMQVEP